MDGSSVRGQKMILRDIITELETKFPSKLTEREWITFINSAIRRYGKDLAVENYFRFKLKGGERSYPLPSDVASGVKAVSVNGNKIDIILYGDTPTDTCCVISPTGYITFSFSPKDGDRAILLYSAPKQFMTWEDVQRDYTDDYNEKQQREIYDGQQCGICEEYIDVIITGAMADYAETDEDIEKAQMYCQNAEQMFSSARQARYGKRGKYPTTKAVNKIRWRRYLWR